MRHVIPAVLAVTLAMGGVALAQTGATSAPSTTPPAKVQATPQTTPTTTTGTLGSSVVGTPNGSSNTAVATSSAQNPKAPVPGANSFTEGEARSRIQDKGFANITGLKLDSQGIWRGTATKDGKNTNVALDYQGNVVAQ